MPKYSMFHPYTVSVNKYFIDILKKIIYFFFFYILIIQDCLSSVNGVANEFSTMGCAKSVDTVAGNQAMGLGIINSFLVVLAFAAIPIMLEIESFFH